MLIFQGVIYPAKNGKFIKIIDSKKRRCLCGSLVTSSESSLFSFFRNHFIGNELFLTLVTRPPNWRMDFPEIIWFSPQTLGKFPPIEGTINGKQSDELTYPAKNGSSENHRLKKSAICCRGVSKLVTSSEGIGNSFFRNHLPVQWGGEWNKFYPQIIPYLMD